jgi:hypothetical protein
MEGIRMIRIKLNQKLLNDIDSGYIKAKDIIKYVCYVLDIEGVDYNTTSLYDLGFTKAFIDKKKDLILM